MVVYANIEMMQSTLAVSNVTAVELIGTGRGGPTKVHEHCPSQPSGIPVVW